MSRFLKEKYKELEPYTPGEQPKVMDLIKLNTNENPYPPSPKAVQALTENNFDYLRLYPDPTCQTLVKAISQNYGLGENQIALGNGSDEILAFIYMAYGEKVYAPAISYGFYPVFGQVFSENFEPINLEDDLTINIEKFYNLDGTILIANPNAPTGIALELDEIEKILKNNPNQIVVIDEAYVDFGAESAVSLIDKYENLIVVQTFSKSRSLAGARIGFALGQPSVIADLNKIKFSFNPYNLSREAIIAGTKAMEDKEYFDETRTKVMETRRETVTKLETLGFEILPSKANFIFAKNPKISGEDYYTKLKEKNIIVRYFNKKPIENYVRITIGKDSEMEQLIKATEEIL